MTAPDSSQPDTGALAAAGMTVAYLSATKLLRDRLSSTVASLFDSGSYRDADANAYVELMGPVSTASQQTMANITAAYLAHQVQMATGEAVPTPTIPPDLVSGVGLRGVDPAAVLRRPYEQVWTALSQGKTLEEAAAIGRRRALDNALTDLQLARTRTAQRVMAQNRLVTGYRRVLTGPHSCALCVVASTHTYRKADLMPIHPQCVPGDSLVWVPSSIGSIPGVIASGQIVAVSRRWYSGELIILETASGQQVRITPNHPVLTDKGWVPAHFISEGDCVYRSLASHRVVGSGPDEQQTPVPIEDVWAALSVVSDLFVVPLASEDFHSDVAQGKVEVVRANCYLPSVWDGQVFQIASKEFFMSRQRRGVVFAGSGIATTVCEIDSAPSRSLMSGSRLDQSLLSGHSAGTKQASIAPSARFDAPGEQLSPQSAPIYARRGLDLVRRLTGGIEPDCVVETRRVSFTGHVYNLHTREGWYQSDSHIVSNCDCAVEPLVAGQTVPETPLDQVHEAIRRDLGAQYVSPDARRGIDYRKVLVTHEHGEIGPVLAVRGQHFTSMADIRNDQ